MPYPTSSDVAGGQPTASAHYNNLRKDAIYLGQSSADAAPLGTFFSHFVENMSLEYLALNKVYCPYVASKPTRIMINGYMLYQVADIELPVSIFSGAAAIWYIFANRTPASPYFSLTVSTSPIEAADQRLVGQCYWDGTNVIAGSVYSYFDHDLPAADYDSGWFAVANSTTYTKTTNFYSLPRMVMLLHNSASDGSGNTHIVYSGETAAGPGKDVVQISTTSIVMRSGNSGTGGTLFNNLASSNSGYWRVLAWR